MYVGAPTLGLLVLGFGFGPLSLELEPGPTIGGTI
jgi:hypothetical protein